jgi:rhamnosyltransferase
VVIRTLNEAELLGHCLESLREQRGHFDLDVLVVDSGSTDATLDIAREGGARIVTMPPDQFDYSKALNLGIENVDGELVASLSAHAIPTDDSWLETMVASFVDRRVAGVSSRQVPWKDAPWQEVHRLRHQFGTVRTTYVNGDRDEILFSNAASMIRREVWEQHPFVLPAVEDVDWAQRVVAAGWHIVYEPSIAVSHSHYEGPRAQARRMIDIYRAHDEASRVPRTRRRTVRDAAVLLIRDGTTISRLDEPFGRRLAYWVELAKMVGYFVVDFTRSGTTAERRRVDG